jgi:hypothetical protein
MISHVFESEKEIQQGHMVTSDFELTWFLFFYTFEHDTDPKHVQCVLDFSKFLSFSYYLRLFLGTAVTGTSQPHTECEENKL